MRSSPCKKSLALIIVTSGVLAQTAATAAPLTPVKFNTPPRDYAQTYTANLVATGDFNGDGTLDIVTIDETANRGEIHLGNGNGTFKPGIVFYTGPYANNVATGDFNHDGKLDLIVGSFLLLGNGNGTFQPPVNTGLDFDPGSLAVADLNGDGNLDLVASAEGLKIFSALGNGDGTFQAPQSLTFAQFQIDGLALADVNQDGIPDLVGVTGIPNGRPGALRVALGNGDGSFKTPVSFPVGAYPSQLAIADFNNDGYLDVVVSDGTSQSSGVFLTVLLGDGTGSFGPGINSTALDCIGNIAAADMNNDGKVDVVTGCPANSTGSVAVYPGNGDGTLEAPLQTAVLYGGSIAVADFNKDGNLDVVSGNEAPDISVLLGRGNGHFEAAPHFTHPAPASNLAIGDVTGDGRPDLVTINKTGAIETLPGNGNSTFGTPVFSYSIMGAGTLVLADFNGDGKLDAASIKLTKTPAVFVQLSNGDGTFQPPVTIPTTLGPVSLAVGDFNGDGKVDLAFGNSGRDSVSILLGNGDGTFQPALFASTALSESLTLAVADLNGDGKLDLIIGDTLFSTIAVLLGNGDGTFQPAISLALPSYSYTGFITAGDLNGDGFPDLAFASNSSVDVLLGNGNGTFQPLVRYSAGQYLVGLKLADMNLDGRLDLVALTNGNDLVVLPGFGDGTFQAVTDGTVSYGTSNLPISIVVGDVNGDGKPDAIAETTTDISVFTNETN